MNPIIPEHYNKGKVDLFESAYLTRPFNEVRAILEFTAERYIKRDKKDRVEDISKAIETLTRLREYEEKQPKKKNIPKKDNTIYNIAGLMTELEHNSGVWSEKDVLKSIEGELKKYYEEKGMGK